MWVYLLAASGVCVLIGGGFLSTPAPTGTLWQAMAAMTCFLMAAILASGAAICATIDQFRALFDKVARFTVRRSEPEHQEPPPLPQTHTRRPTR